MEQELAFLHTTLEQILGKDNEVRPKAEAALMNIKHKEPSKCALYLLKILAQSKDEGVRMLSAVLLRRFTSVILDEEGSLWQAIQPDEKHIFKEQVLNLLNTEQVRIVRIRICDLVAELGGSIFETDKEHWKELLLKLAQMFQSESEDDLETAFRICESYIPYAFDQFKDHYETLGKVLERGIVSNNFNLAEAAIDCFASICALIESKEIGPFQGLLKPALQLPVRALHQGDEESARCILITLTDIVEAEPGFFTNNHKLVGEMVDFVLKAEDLCDMSIKNLPVQLLVNLVERRPKFGKKNKQFLETVFSAIMELMVMNDEEPSQDWSHPKEGFSIKEDEEPDDAVKNGRQWVDTLISALGTQITLPLISEIIRHALLDDTQTWQWKAASLMVVSQIGEYLDLETDGVAKIQQIVPVIVKHLAHTHPKVRYAAGHALGQIADDMRPQFQENFHEVVMPGMFQLLCDPVPRVVAHGGGCLANIIEGMSKGIVGNYLEQFLQKFLSLLQDPDSCSLIKQGSAASITSIAQAAQEDFAPYFQNMMEMLMGAIANMNSKELINLRGHCIECVSMMIKGVGKKKAMPYLDTVITVFTQLVEQPMDDGDITRQFIYSAWGRICRVFEEDLSPYMHSILPGLFKLAEQKILAQTKEGKPINLSTGQELDSSSATDIDMALKELREANRSSKDKLKETAIKMSVSTAESEEKSIAIEMIATFVEHMDADTLGVYMAKFSDLVVPLCNENMSAEVRQIASTTLVSLIQKLKKTTNKELNNEETLNNCARLFLKTLWGALNSESDNETIITQTQAIKSILEEVKNFLTTEEINQMGEELMKLMQESDVRKDENEQLKKNEEADEGDITLLEEDIECEADVQVSVCEVIGTIFETHKEKSLQLMKALYDEVLPDWLSQDPKKKNPEKQKLAIYILDDAIEYLGVGLLGTEFYQNCMNLYFKYAQHTQAEHRQAAVYGIGVASINADLDDGKNAFIPFSNKCYQALCQAISKAAPKTKDKRKIKMWGHAYNNAVAAMGKIIKALEAKLPNATEWVSTWASHLPLEYDSGEGKPTHKYFVELLSQNQEEMIKAIGDFGRVISMFGKILETKFIDKETYEMVQKLLTAWQSNPEAAEQIKAIISNPHFNDKWKKRLGNCVEGAEFKESILGIDGELVDSEEDEPE